MQYSTQLKVFPDLDLICFQPLHFQGELGKNLELKKIPELKSILSFFLKKKVVENSHKCLCFSTGKLIVI